MVYNFSKQDTACVVLWGLICWYMHSWGIDICIPWMLACVENSWVVATIHIPKEFALQHKLESDCVCL